MRRRPGVGGIQKQKLEQERYKDKGTEIQENQLEQMSKQLEIFRTNLEDFAANHKHGIIKNPTFRRQFQDMCSSIGVDPLASGKGFWSVLNLGDFYHELSVQIVEICLATSEKNGGLISLDEVRDRLIRTGGKNKQDITIEDLLTAAKKLRIFGNGFSFFPIGKGKYMVQSIPGELSMDQTTVLSQATALGTGCVSVSVLEEKLKWERSRSEKVLQLMLKGGSCWVDSQDSPEPTYWFPSLFSACIAS